MKRCLAIFLYSTPILLILPMITIWNPAVYDYYFTYMITIVTFIITIVSLIFAIRSKERDERIFFVLLSSSALLYFIDFLADLLDLSIADYPLGFYDELSDLIGALPILALLLYRIIADSKYIKKESRISLLLGSLVASSGFVLLGVLALRVALSTAGIPESAILLYLPFLIVNILNMALLVTLYILYVEANFRYFLLALLSGYFFVFVGDVFELLYGFYESTGDRITAKSATLFGFTLLLVVLLAIRLSNISLSTMKHIETEREKYKDLYLDLDDKLRELLVFTQFLRHDFGNDIVVISNALEIYKENQSVDLLKMAEKRLELMNERISSLRTKEELYSSLKTQAVPITFIEDIAKLFSNISTRIKNRKLLIKGNQLLNSVLFNIIDNAFKHGGENVEVKISTETKDQYIIIYIIDNGVGMTDFQKEIIKNRISTLDENMEIPDSVGLTLAKITLNSLGGDLLIRDNDPQGTIIILELPIFENKKE